MIHNYGESWKFFLFIWEHRVHIIGIGRGYGELVWVWIPPVHNLLIKTFDDNQYITRLAFEASEERI